MDLTNKAGTRLARPSQTLYLGRDTGHDADRTTSAEKAVAAWRLAGQLPFPRLTPDEIARLNATLAYPAEGSPEAGHDSSAASAAEAAEPLSAPPPSDERSRTR